MKLNLFYLNRVFMLLSVATLAVFTSNLRANAEDPNSTDALPIGQAEVSLQRVQFKRFSQPRVAQIASRVTDPIPGKVPTSANKLTQGLAASLTIAQTTSTTPGSATPGSTTPATGADTLAPSGSVVTPGANTPTNQAPVESVPQNTQQPGTQTPVESSPQNTQQPGTQTPVESVPQNTQQPGTQTPVESNPQTIQQPVPDQTPASPGGASQFTTEVSPGRVTRSGSSYVGVGGNIGIGSGDTQLGQGSFAVLSKIGLLPSVSVRPALLFSDDVTILVPFTYDFSFGEGPTGRLGFSAAPFVGVGVAISTGDGANADLLLTGGIDVPLSSQFTATASVNATVTGEAAIGVLLGVGYNFQGF